MALRPVNPESVRQDLLGLTLWFTEGERNLLIVHDERGIIFFEYTDANKVVHGGRGLQFKAGEIGSSHTPLSYLRRSRMIEYQESIKGEITDALKKDIEACEAMPPYLRQTLNAYLNGDFRNLEFISPLKNYRPSRKTSALTALFQAIPQQFRYRLSRWLNGWFLPVTMGVIVACVMAAFIYKQHTKYDPARLCLNTGHYNDCAETLKRSLTSQEPEQKSVEQALQKLLLFCKDRSQPDACNLIFDYYKKKNDNAWVKENLIPNCRPDSLNNICSLLHRIFAEAFSRDGAETHQVIYSQALQCQYLRQLVNKKLAVNTLDLNLLHELRECPRELTLSMDASDTRSLCHEWGICTPSLVDTLWKKRSTPEDVKRLISALGNACRTYQDDQCILSACIWTTEINKALFRPDEILFWKDAEREKHIWAKSIPQLYPTMTSSEQGQARESWNRECSSGDIRSCFAYASTSADKDLSQNVKKFCSQLPEYLKKAPPQELLALRLSLKLSGE